MTADEEADRAVGEPVEGEVAAFRVDVADVDALGAVRTEKSSGKAFDDPLDRARRRSGPRRRRCRRTSRPARVVAEDLRHVLRIEELAAHNCGRNGSSRGSSPPSSRGAIARYAAEIRFLLARGLRAPSAGLGDGHVERRVSRRRLSWTVALEELDVEGVEPAPDGPRIRGAGPRRAPGLRPDAPLRDEGPITIARASAPTPAGGRGPAPGRSTGRNRGGGETRSCAARESRERGGRRASGSRYAPRTATRASFHQPALVRDGAVVRRDPYNPGGDARACSSAPSALSLALALRPRARAPRDGHSRTSGGWLPTRPRTRRRISSASSQSTARRLMQA